MSASIDVGEDAFLDLRLAHACLDLEVLCLGFSSWSHPHPFLWLWLLWVVAQTLPVTTLLPLHLLVLDVFKAAYTMILFSLQATILFVTCLIGDSLLLFHCSHLVIHIFVQDVGSLSSWLPQLFLLHDLSLVEKLALQIL